MYTLATRDNMAILIILIIMIIFFILIIWSGLVLSAGQHLEWDEAVITSVANKQPNKQPNKQLPDYSASPDFFVGPIGLLEIWRSAITKLFIEQPRLHRVC